MTQRIFDVENEKDMALLWSILPDDVKRLKKNESNTAYRVYVYSDLSCFITQMLKINWHDKTEITRPTPEATEADIGKLCMFWDCEDKTVVSVYKGLDCDGWFLDDQATCWKHCRRLTADEVKELC